MADLIRYWPIWLMLGALGVSLAVQTFNGICEARDRARRFRD